jgi:hypothetical protein
MQTTIHKDLQDSGVHNTPFYTKRYLPNIDIEDVEWDRELHKEHNFDEDDLIDLSEDEIDDRVLEDFYNNAFIYNTYYEVDACHYNEDVAYKCNLIPFKISNDDEDSYLLALGGCGMDLSPKLDAYFFLHTGKMDSASNYFNDKDYFKSLASDEIFNRIEAKFGGVTL